jgi:CRP/FNR family transcriptional regulator, anaerobic regulatory protein
MAIVLLPEGVAMERVLNIHNSDVPVLCQSCEARHRGVCGALDPDQLRALSKASSKRSVEPGAELVADAEPVTSYSNVLAGVVKLTKTMSDGRQQIVGLQFAPDFLGQPFRAESALTAEAATGVSLCSFPKSAMDRMISQSPQLEHRILKQAMKELDEAREWMLALGRKTASERIASFLLFIARNIDPMAPADRKTATFNLPLIRSDIGDFLGLTIETVSRQITKLRAEGIIHVENNRTVTINDMGRLAARAGS